MSPCLCVTSSIRTFLSSSTRWRSSRLSEKQVVANQDNTEHREKPANPEVGDVDEVTVVNGRESIKVVQGQTSVEKGVVNGVYVVNKPSTDSSAAVPERAAWNNQTEFVLTLVGYAVGLGNVWRFPYLCYKNGGGAFLVPYFGTLALVGLPLFFLELAFGQFASLGPIAAWTLNPLFKGLGYSMVIVNTVIGIYYNVIIAWTIHYLISSMTSHLPWEGCGNWWNTVNCVTQENLNATESGILSLSNFTVSRESTKTPSEEYFYNRVLQLSGGIDEAGTIVWQLALCLLLSWTIVFFVLIRGISSLGKVVYFSTLFPYVVLTIMLIRGVTLDGAAQGILYYLKPDFSRLSDARAWSDAATQIFFSLSTCSGGLMAMASYNPFKNNCLRDAIMIPIINCATSFYAGFAIFSVLGFMAHTKGVSISQVAASGPGLVFVVFPEALSTMPVAPLWSILFFLMMMTLGLSSEFSIVECFFSAVIDEFPALSKTRRRSIVFRLMSCIVFYLIGLSMVTNGGFYLFNIVDYYIGGFPLLIVGLLECIALSHVYGYSNFAQDIEMMIGKRPTLYFRLCWCFISPGILLVIIVFMAVQYSTPTLFSNHYAYPAWAESLGCCVVTLCVGIIPVWFLTAFLYRGGLQLLKATMRPTDRWGPSNPLHRVGKYASYPLNNSTQTNVIDVTSPLPVVTDDAVLDVTQTTPNRRRPLGEGNEAFDEDDEPNSSPRIHIGAKRVQHETIWF